MWLDSDMVIVKDIVKLYDRYCACSKEDIGKYTGLICTTNIGKRTKYKEEAQQTEGQNNSITLKNAVLSEYSARPEQEGEKIILKEENFTCQEFFRCSGGVMFFNIRQNDITTNEEPIITNMYKHDKYECRVQDEETYFQYFISLNAGKDASKYKYVVEFSDEYDCKPNPTTDSDRGKVAVWHWDSLCRPWNILALSDGFIENINAQSSKDVKNIKTL